LFLLLFVFECGVFGALLFLLLLFVERNAGELLIPVNNNNNKASHWL